MSKLLSICIPTYNMGKYLEINLKELVVIIIKNKLKNRVEISISDNDSSDNTFDIVNKYINQNENIKIKYHKNDVNIGADKNFLKSVEIASAEYAWIFGADDIIIEKSLLDILELIISNNYDILLGDRVNINLNGKEINTQYWSTEKMTVNKENLSEYLNQSYRIGAVFSYISSIVFKKNKWDEEIEKLDINRFIGTAYIHSLILLSMIQHNSNMLYMHSPLVKNRVGNDSFLSEGYFNRIKIDFNYLDIFDYLFGSDSKEYKSMRLFLDRERVFLHFIKAKYLVSNNEKIKNEFNTFLSDKHIKNKNLIMFFPNIMIKILLKLYKKRG